MSDIIAIFQSFWCPKGDISFQITSNLEQHSTSCSEQVKHLYPKNVYQIRKTLFDKIDCFVIEKTRYQKLFKNLAKSDFESISVQKESFKDTKTTTWIGKHVPLSLSISLNHVHEPIFPCNSEPHHLVASFIRALERLTSQN